MLKQGSVGGKFQPARAAGYSETSRAEPQKPSSESPETVRSPSTFFLSTINSASINPITCFYGWTAFVLSLVLRSARQMNLDQKQPPASPINQESNSSQPVVSPGLAS